MKLIVYGTLVVAWCSG